MASAVEHFLPLVSKWIPGSNIPISGITHTEEWESASHARCAALVWVEHDALDACTSQGPHDSMTDSSFSRK